MDWPELAKDLKPVYTAPSAQAALDRIADFSSEWEKRYPAMIRLWTDAWDRSCRSSHFDVEIRRVVCTTDEIVKSSLLVGWFGLSVGDEDLVGAFSLFDDGGLRGSALLVVVGRARGAVVAMPGWGAAVSSSLRRLWASQSLAPSSVDQPRRSRWSACRVDRRRRGLVIDVELGPASSWK
jgi:hypothetical protein